MMFSEPLENTPTTGKANCVGCKKEIPYIMGKFFCLKCYTEIHMARCKEERHQAKLEAQDN